MINKMVTEEGIKFHKHNFTKDANEMDMDELNSNEE